MEDPCPFCRAPPPEDDAEVLAHIRRHVVNEVPEAIRQLAINYANGQLGLVKSSKKAVRLFKRAVELGDTEAMFKLGIMYERGERAGVKLNHVKAMQLWRAAADRGDARGQAMMAHCLLKPDPEALEDDLKAGFRYAKLSSDRGYTLGSFLLGKAYYFGSGVEKRDDEVIRLFTIVLAKGDLPESNNSFMREVIAELSA
jgi:TPR repeat protein